MIVRIFASAKNLFFLFYLTSFQKHIRVSILYDISLKYYLFIIFFFGLVGQIVELML